METSFITTLKWVLFLTEFCEVKENTYRSIAPLITKTLSYLK